MIKGEKEVEKKFREGLVSLTPPAVPMFGVFSVEGAPDDLWIAPVITLALVEEEAGNPGSRVIRPLCHERDTGLDSFWWEPDDALGYLLEGEVSRAAQIFSGELARERQRVKRRKEAKRAKPE